MKVLCSQAFASPHLWELSHRRSLRWRLHLRHHGVCPGSWLPKDSRRRWSGPKLLILCTFMGCSSEDRMKCGRNSTTEKSGVSEPCSPQARDNAGNQGHGLGRRGEALLGGVVNSSALLWHLRVHFRLVPYCAEVSTGEKCLGRGLDSLIRECQMETVARQCPRCPDETGLTAGQCL